MRRIAPYDTMPEHILEMGYLTDLSTAIKCVVHGIRAVGLPTLDNDLLAAWALVHRPTLIRCAGYDGLIPLIERDCAHTAEIERIDALIDKLKRGLAEEDALKYVKASDVVQMGHDRQALGRCLRKRVWY